ncbi:LysR family transcriptional regulator [Litchfieldella qijiaojingensis]|uniref:LysR family transcriptional regulator n=1 Tax=Litchfieldella qijiaojingensis TaxID=980347 RepID=A0ABQ2Z819_9GAMM|nr:LysR family transcriptional regulator [Halomonas qijiaojingensis]GGY04312.1 LysR family transcriptional regulator [Halomonas qijiaojingensis]
MDIPHQRLVYFRIAAESGSVRRAASRLDIAPSAVSRQIALLEEALGAVLIERQRHGIRLTPVGEMLLEYCERRGALDESFIASLEAYQRLETGTVSLVVGEGFVSDLIASPLREFTERYSGIQLDIHLAGTTGIIEAIVEDQAHIGLMFHERTHPQLRFWASSPQPLMAILPPDHPLAAQATPLTLEQISDQPMAMWDPGHGVRQMVDQAFQQAHLRPRLAMNTNSMVVLAQYVRSGMGITLLPGFAVAHDLDVGTLVARPVDDPLFQRSQAHMVTRIGRQQPKASVLLLRHLQHWMQAFRDAEAPRLP